MNRNIQIADFAELRMMIRLCVKDFVSAWLFLTIMLAFYIFNGPVFFRFHTSAYLLFAGGMILSGFFAILFLEDKYGTDLILCSLPLCRRTIVSARYLASLFVIFSGAAVCFTIAYLLEDLNWFTGAGRHSRLSGEGALTFILIMIIIPALFLPFYYRLGFGRGLAAFLLAGLGVPTAAGIVGLIIAGSAGAPESFPELAGALGGNFMRAVSQVRRALGGPLFFGLLAAFAAGLEFLSIKLSVLFYGRRDL